MGWGGLRCNNTQQSAAIGISNCPNRILGEHFLTCILAAICVLLCCFLLKYSFLIPPPLVFFQSCWDGSFSNHRALVLFAWHAGVVPPLLPLPLSSSDPIGAYYFSQWALLVVQPFLIGACQNHVTEVNSS